MADAAGKGMWLTADAGPLFGLRMSVARRPWRIGPAWAVAAGAVAAGMPLVGAGSLLMLLGAVILADAVWGGIWAAMAGGQPAEREPETWSVPYVQPMSPMVRIARRLGDLAPGMGCHELLVTIALALGLALLLGPLPLALSAAVVVCAFFAQVIAERGRRPALLYALLAVALPWSLGLALVGRPLAQLAGPLALGTAFTWLEWGAQRLRWPVPGSAGGALAGELAIIAVLALLRLPWAAALAAALFLPPTWWLLRAQSECGGARGASGARSPAGPAASAGIAARALGFATHQSTVWWWLAFLLSAAALRQLMPA